MEEIPASKTARRSANYGPHLGQIPWVRQLLAIVAIYGLLQILFSFWDALQPLVLGLVLAYLAVPWFHFTERRWHWPRWLSSTFVLLVWGLVISGFMLWLWPVAAEQMRALSQKLPDYFRIAAHRVGVDSSTLMPELQARLLAALQNPGELVKQIFIHTGKTYQVLVQVLGEASYLLGLTFLIPVFFVCFSLILQSWTPSMWTWLPKSSRPQIQSTLIKMDRAVAEFFRGRVLVAAIMCVLFSFGWWLADVPYWFVLGLLAGVTNMIPYLSALFWPLAILLKYLEVLSQGHQEMSFTSILLWPSLAYVLAQLLEGWVLTPWIQSRGNQLGVIPVLFAVYLGGAMFGFWGLVLAIPVASCLKIIWDDYGRELVRQWSEEH